MQRDLDEEIRQFRARHKLCSHTCRNATWKYYVAGSGSELVVILPGAPGIAEMAFPYIQALEQHARVLAPSYPPEIAHIDDLISDLIELIEHETSDPVHLVGASYSGMVLQALLACCTDQVASILIGDTGIPRPIRALQIELLVAVLTKLPTFGLHGTLYLFLSYVLYGRSPQHRFWQRYFRGVVADLTTEAFANRLRVWISMERRERNGSPRGEWHGPALLLETHDDPLFSPAERRALRGRFPNAEVHTFSSKGHITALVNTAEYTRLIRDFILRRIKPDGSH
jgi:pimeloyl-ACP methyl ester carboxylesterase